MKRILFGLLAATSMVAAGALLDPGGSVVQAQDCARRYVSSGDDIPFGHDVSDTERFPNHLIEDHLKKWGPWCNYDIAVNGATSSAVISQGQLAQTWNYRPDLISLTVGEQNTTIVNLVSTCFDNVKDHDFAQATARRDSAIRHSGWVDQQPHDDPAVRVIMAGSPADGRRYRLLDPYQSRSDAAENRRTVSALMIPLSHAQLR